MKTLILLFISLFYIKSVMAVNYNSSSGFRLNKNNTNEITVNGICYRFTNTSSSIDYFIPTTHLSDFQSFLSHKPGDITQAPCMINCIGSWGACVAGIETYTISTPAAHGGSPCPFSNGDTRPNPTCALASVNCIGSWGSCVAGIETYTISTPEANGGSPCPNSNGDTRPNPSCAVTTGTNCVGSFVGSCKANGTRLYTVTTPEQNGGLVCPYANNTFARDLTCSCYEVKTHEVYESNSYSLKNCSGWSNLPSNNTSNCPSLTCASSSRSWMESNMDCTSGAPMYNGINYTNCTYSMSFSPYYFQGKVTCDPIACP